MFCLINITWTYILNFRCKTTLWTTLHLRQRLPLRIANIHVQFPSRIALSQLATRLKQYMFLKWVIQMRCLKSNYYFSNSSYGAMLFAAILKAICTLPHGGNYSVSWKKRVSTHFTLSTFPRYFFRRHRGDDFCPWGSLNKCQAACREHHTGYKNTIGVRAVSQGLNPIWKFMKQVAYEPSLYWILCPPPPPLLLIHMNYCVSWNYI
jgi:hypothetical protein